MKINSVLSIYCYVCVVLYWTIHITTIHVTTNALVECFNIGISKSII
jgi:hypothetical protein